MIGRVVDLPGLLTIAVIAVVAFLLPVIVGSVRSESGARRGIEAAVLTVLGGLFARLFISILLASANDSHGAGLAVGWGFFLIPGIVDTLAGQALLTTPANLMIFAAVIGHDGGHLSDL